ncbi:MAG TPA: hypothetical protein VF268_15370 [Gammaproteobacteria bacterium]
MQNETLPAETEAKKPVSELEYALKDVDLLIAYLSKTGKSVPKELVGRLVQAKHRGPVAQWTADQEADFWFTFNEIARLISPVTMASLKAFAVNLDYAYAVDKNSRKGKLQRTIFRYGMMAFAVVFSIVVLHTYHFVGNDVLNKSQELFEERNKVREELEKRRLAASGLMETAGVNRNLGNTLWQDEEYQLLAARERTLDQEFDANRTLLFQWNMVWRLGQKMEPELSMYDEYRYSAKVDKLTREKQALETGLGAKPEDADRLASELVNVERELYETLEDVSLHKARDLFFRSGLSAMFVLNLLHDYLLPMLYGCLGAFAMVLRAICNSIKSETFSGSYALDYNLRITLGAVSGMASGLFMGDNTLLNGGGFSMMLIAFIVGYNVDVLFALIDNAAGRLIPKGKDEAVQGSPLKAKLKQPEPAAS